MNSVYNHMTATQLEAFNNAVLYGFAPTYDCMANRINWAYNERTINDVASKALTNGIFGEQSFIKNYENIASDLRERIFNLEDVIGSLREQLEEITLSIDAASTLANTMDVNVIQDISAARKDELESAQYYYYVVIRDRSEKRNSPIIASLYRTEIGNIQNSRFIKDLVEVPYENRHTLAGLVADHSEVKQIGISLVIIPTHMHHKVSHKPFAKHFDVFEDLEVLKELN